MSETAWSDQKARKERREERREKRMRKRLFDKKQREENGVAAPDNHGGDETGQGYGENDDAADDWAGDEREAKRARKGRAAADTFTDSRFDDL